MTLPDCVAEYGKRKRKHSPLMFCEIRYGNSIRGAIVAATSASTREIAKLAR
jgi:hypothetical protein